MMVGSGYIPGEMCDGQSLASPGRWPVDMRRYPHSPLWNSMSSKYMVFAESIALSVSKPEG